MAEILTPGSFGAANQANDARVLASVNGKPITDEDVTRFLKLNGKNATIEDTKRFIKSAQNERETVHRARTGSPPLLWLRYNFPADWCTCPALPVYRCCTSSR